MRKRVTLIILMLPLLVFGQTLPSAENIDPEVLNSHILNEVNKYRKKARVHLITNNDALLDAAQDHSDYLSKRKKLSHKQRFNKHKRWPKNRVDLYGRQFDIVGENVQVNDLNLSFPIDDKKNPRITTYEQLAEKMVLSWKNSPPHYKNMISEQYHHTYTAVTITDEGRVYGCQLFGGTEYKDAYAGLHDTVDYKPDNPKRCLRCLLWPPSMGVMVGEDSMIYAFSPKKKFTRLRLANPWTTAIAADIVLKSQYPCDTLPYFNGRTAVRGIPLEPVYRKDFRKGTWRRYNVMIPLGKVPDYIDEEFEVNVTFIYNKRTCGFSITNIIPSDYHVDIPLRHDLPNLVLEDFTTKDTTLVARINFEKASSEVDSLQLAQAMTMLAPLKNRSRRLELVGFASIEGSTEGNIELYENRAARISEALQKNGFDTTQLRISARENYADFRKDILETEFTEWAVLNDGTLKSRVNEHADTLEPILAKHRFVEVRLTLLDTIFIHYDVPELVDNLQLSLSKANYDDAQAWLKACYSEARFDSSLLTTLEAIDIPLNKKSFDLVYEKAMYEYRLRSDEPDALDTLKVRLTSMLALKKKKSDKRANTSLAIVDYYLFSRNFPLVSKPTRKWFNKMNKRKYVDKKTLARIQLNVASTHDWILFYNPLGTGKARKYMYRKAKRYVRNARLEVDDVFDLASYYSFFGDDKTALQLTRKKIDETTNPDHHVFFLKLIHLNDPGISRRQYLKYFKRVRTYAGDQFCTYFNSPNLNFQIFDDPEIHEIYCEECTDTDK